VRVYSRSTNCRAASFRDGTSRTRSGHRLGSSRPIVPRTRPTSRLHSATWSPVAANGQPVDARTSSTTRHGELASLTACTTTSTTTPTAAASPEVPSPDSAHSASNQWFRAGDTPPTSRAPRRSRNTSPALTRWVDQHLPHGDGNRRPHRPTRRALPPADDGWHYPTVDQHPSSQQHRLLPDAFVKHFEGSYSRATTIEDLEHCI
jgi:hypothetical protein